MDKQKLFKELDNFWYYYRVHVVVGVLILGVILYIFLTDDPVKNSALDVVMIGNTSQIDQQELEQAATDKILGQDSNAVIKVSFWPVEGAFLTNSQNGGLQQKLVAMISAKGIDVLIMDKKAFLFYAKQRTFLKLDSVKQQLPKSTQFLKAPGMNGQNYNFGIKVDQNQQLQQVGYNTKNKVLGIVANTEHKRRAIAFIQWLAVNHG